MSEPAQPGDQPRPLSQRVVAATFEGFVRAALRTHVKITVIGREHIPSGGFVIVSNHTSHLDSVVLMQVCGGRFDRFHLAAASDYFFGTGPVSAGPSQTAVNAPKSSKFGALLRTALHLEPMPRRRLDGETAERDEAIRLAFANLVETCRRGDVVVYFPEGSRSPDGTIRRFRNGIDELGAQLEGPIVPVHIEGAYELWPKGKRWTRRGR